MKFVLTLCFEIMKTPMKNHVNYLRSVEKFGNFFIYLTISKENMVRIESLVCLNEQNHLQYDIREVTSKGRQSLARIPRNNGNYAPS